MSNFDPDRLIRTILVLGDVQDERRRQDERYGDVNEHTPLGFGPQTRWLLPYTTDSAADIEAKLRADYMDYQDEVGPQMTWAHLIREELAEAFAESDLARARAELIQVAALCVSAIEKIDAGTLPEEGATS